jgi:hypothetical protein
MSLHSVSVIVMQSGFWGTLGDPKQLGEATLIAIGAIILGTVVWRLWPKSASPALFGSLAALGLIAGLAYMGVSSAGLVLWLAIAAVVLIGGLALVTGGL